MAKTQVIHAIDAANTEVRGLKCWDGQFEESTSITVVPSQLVIATHKRQKYFEWDPATGTHKIVTTVGPLTLKGGRRRDAILTNTTSGKHTDLNCRMI